LIAAKLRVLELDHRELAWQGYALVGRDIRGVELGIDKGKV
jgi:hypothetical protein